MIRRPPRSPLFPSTPLSQFYFHPPRHIGRKVRNNHICSCSSNPRQHLHHNTSFINPPLLSSSFNHRKFTAHVICCNWQVTMLTYLPDNVQVSQGRLHHHNICPLRNIQVSFPQRLAYITRAHLVRAPTADLRRWTFWFTECPPASGSILG